jgi:hypothetical protein
MPYVPSVSKEEEKARIQELERELAQLRERVDDDPSEAVGELEQTVAAPTLPKMLLIGAIVIVLSLGFFVAVHTALSKGFTSLANKAASTYAHEFTEEDEESTSTQPATRPPRVPGL